MSGIKIGELIKDARIKSGFKTKKELSDVTGVSPATLSRIENNTQAPTPDTLIRLSKHLNTVTYGELMKAANYFDGLEEQQANFLVDMFNESIELDNKIFELLEMCYSFTSVYPDIHTELVSMFAAPELLHLYRNVEVDEIKTLYYRNDYDTQTKKEISEKLSNLINSYPKQLITFFKKRKDIKPVPLLSTICSDSDLVTNKNLEEYINYPLLTDKQPEFALKVVDDSFIGIGIKNGDIVFLLRASWVEFNGQIAAVSIKGEGKGLKKVSWTEGSAKFTISSENELYPSTEVNPNELTIHGLYAGHFRPMY